MTKRVGFTCIVWLLKKTRIFAIITIKKIYWFCCKTNMHAFLREAGFLWLQLLSRGVQQSWKSRVHDVRRMRPAGTTPKHPNNTPDWRFVFRRPEALRVRFLWQLRRYGAGEHLPSFFRTVVTKLARFWTEPVKLDNRQKAPLCRIITT